MKLIEINLAKIFELCRRYRVQTLYVFGSILTNRFNEDSDVDFLVKFNDDEIDVLDYGDNFFGLQFALEDMFNRRIDLVCDDAIKNSYFRKEVDRTKHLIYG